jgi:hypothetical protein
MTEIGIIVSRVACFIFDLSQARITGCSAAGLFGSESLARMTIRGGCRFTAFDRNRAFPFGGSVTK